MPLWLQILISVLQAILSGISSHDIPLGADQSEVEKHGNAKAILEKCISDLKSL